MSEISLFNTKCGWCGTPMKSYAYNRSGDVKLQFCSNPCETFYNDKKKYDPRFVKTVRPEFKHKLSTDEVAGKVAKVRWANRSYEVEEVAI